MIATLEAKRARVLDRLHDDGLVDESAISRAKAAADRTGRPVEQVLNELGSLSDDDLARIYAEVVPCEVWSPAKSPVIQDLGDYGISTEFLRGHRGLLVQTPNAGMACAACDPLDENLVSGLAFATGRPVRVLSAKPAEWRRAYDETFVNRERAASPDTKDTPSAEPPSGQAEGSGAHVVTQAFEAAIAARASDVHFEPRRNDLRIRFRVDGQMVEHRVLPSELASPVTSRIKVMANLNLGERRLPQDGRTTFVVNGRQVDVRVATSPTVFGESVVLRILDRAEISLQLNELGLSPHILQILLATAKAPHGIFLVAGPTGSGKTTTLYALLQSFVGTGRKILSVEDPVEFHFDHVSQTQTASAIGLTFATALRSFLRQDPDIIMVGEIRDAETASVAVQAAMTGHFVVASVHANTALAVIPRLLDMGLEPYQLAASLRGCISQRLVRKLCRHCAVEGAPSLAEREFLHSYGLEADRVPAARGCPRCSQSGFRGRIPIGEAFSATEEMLRSVAEQSSVDVAALAAATGFQSIGFDGCRRALEGLTTLGEVMAAVDG